MTAAWSFEDEETKYARDILSDPLYMRLERNLWYFWVYIIQAAAFLAAGLAIGYWMTGTLAGTASGASSGARRRSTALMRATSSRRSKGLVT